MCTPPRARPACGRAQRGLTMVELMVSVTIGLIIVGAVMYVYLGSRGAYRTSKSSSRIQEAGRFGLDSIMRDVRQVGFIGCGSRMSLPLPAPPLAPQLPLINQIANPPLQLGTPATMAQGVYGYAAASYQPGAAVTWPLAPALAVPRVAGDVLVLRVAVGAPVMMAQNPDPTIPAIYLANNCGNIKTGDYLMVSSCTMATVLRVSNSPKPSTAPGICVNGGATVSNPPVEIDHGKTDSKGNVVNGNPPLGATSLTATPNAPSSLVVQSLASAQAFDEVTYYVGQLAGRPAPALYRISAAALATAGPAAAAEEIIDHVENMSVVYGVGGAGNVVFETADQVSAANAWANVVSVRVSLLAAGDELGAVDAPQTLPFGATVASTAAPSTITAADTRLRQVFTETAALRDRLQ